MTADQKEPATLQVGGDEVKLEMPMTREIDVHDRDPMGMVQHVKIKFQDVIAEPDTEVFSFDSVWVTSYKVFTTTKLWCYRITSLIFAVPLAVLWGITFACISFCNSWVCLPVIKTEEIEMNCVRKIWEFFLGTFVGPCFEAMGKCFGGMRFRMVKEG